MINSWKKAVELILIFAFIIIFAVKVKEVY